jgi:hypothetical protein
MDVEYTGTCKYDWVQFKNSDASSISLGEGAAANQGKLCGDIIPAPIFSETNGAIVTFHADEVEQRKGFKIEYEIVEAESCSNAQLNTAIGVQPVTFTTLHYPSNYENNQNCDWTITVPSGENVNLVFESFDTENNDDVKVFMILAHSDWANGSDSVHISVASDGVVVTKRFGYSSDASCGNCSRTVRSNTNCTNCGRTVDSSNTNSGSDWANGL